MNRDEFSVIDELFAPLAASAEGAFQLRDDAALLNGNDFVVTKDLLIAGVHFRRKDPLDLVARKLLRVNLSDLAAKGARPVGYFLGCAWPTKTSYREIAAFAEGLRQDQEEFRIALYGGDTTVHVDTEAPLVLSATFFGSPPRHGMLHRNGVHLGDDLYVTGEIGDAGLGLKLLSGDLKMSAPARKTLTDRYFVPTPRVTIGGALAGLASAAIDLSDGLIADCQHLVSESGPGLRAVIRGDDVPHSEPALEWRRRQDNWDAATAFLATAGDDYEILFSAPASRRRSVEMAASVAKTPVSRIGTIAKGEGEVDLINADGELIKLERAGYAHQFR